MRMPLIAAEIAAAAAAAAAVDSAAGRDGGLRDAAAMSVA